MRKIRIGYLLHGISFGGAPKSLYLFLKIFNDERYEKYLYTILTRSAELESLFKAEVDYFEIFKIQTISDTQYGHDTKRSFGYKVKLDYDYVKEKFVSAKLDILHINSTLFPHIVDLIKGQTNIKVITHVREMIPEVKVPGLRSYVIENIKKSDVIIAISDNEAKPFIGHRALNVIPNPFDFSEIANIKKSHLNLKILEDNILVAMLGQFNRYKGHTEFLKSLNYIVNNHIKPKFKFNFIIIGVKPLNPLWKRLIKYLLFIEDYPAKVHNYIKKKNLEKMIHLIPYTSNVNSVLAECDIVVRPAITGDPWGRDIIEAMAMKKPVVATGESEYYVEDGKTGYLVPPGSAGRLAEKIVELINDRQKRETFGENGYKKVRAMCDVNSYGEKITSIYKSLMEDKI